jgi:hypothetical protein
MVDCFQGQCDLQGYCKKSALMFAYIHAVFLVCEIKSCNCHMSNWHSTMAATTGKATATDGAIRRNDIIFSCN